MARRVWLFWLLSVVMTVAVGWLAHRSDVTREQRQLGQELAAQLAASSAPWILNQDMTSLNLLLTGLDSRPGLAQIEIDDANGRRLVMTTLNGLPGQQVIRPILIGQQHLGELRLTLHEPQLLVWLSNHAAPLALIAALQLLCFVLAGRQPRESARTRPVEAAAAPAIPAPGSDTSSPFQPAPPVQPHEALLCIQPDDPRHLLERVSHHLQADIFDVMNLLLERVARLCGGTLVRAMSGPEGALLRFEGCEQGERAWQALCAASLSLQLADRAGQVRSREGLLWLPMKAGLHWRPQGRQDGADIAGLLAWAAPTQQLLVSGAPALPESTRRRARWGRQVTLDIAEIGQLQATPLEQLGMEAEAAIRIQAERLVPLEERAESHPAALV